MSTPLMPELPLISMENCLPYDLIRHIPGYPTEFVRRYASAYGLAVWKAAMEAAANVCEAQEGDNVTKAVAKGCAAAIRSLPLPESDMTQARGE